MIESDAMVLASRATELSIGGFTCSGGGISQSVESFDKFHGFDDSIEIGSR